MIERVSPKSGVDYHVIGKDPPTEKVEVASTPDARDADVAQLARICKYLEEHFPETLGRDVDAVVIELLARVPR